MIEARGLTKRYGPKTAVDGVSFTVRPGTVTGFLGPNGAGKSTTMRMIMGLDRPTAGTVTVNGRPAAVLAPLAVLVARRRAEGRNCGFEWLRGALEDAAGETAGCRVAHEPPALRIGGLLGDAGPGECERIDVPRVAAAVLDVDRMVRRGAVEYADNADRYWRKPDFTLSLTREAWAKLHLNQATVAQLAGAGELKLSGDAAACDRVLDLFDRFDAT